MTDKSCYLAIDIGASSGRHILGWMENGKLRLEEIYRFENRLKTMHGHLCWNLAHLFDEVTAGLKECAALRRIPQSIGIDTWGVDFVLLDEQGQMLGDPISYRDSRTQGMDALVRQKISDKDLYARTGIQKQPFNTIYQLVALREQEPELLTRAHHFLMVPEYLNYLLTGAMVNEYTNATTTQLVNAETQNWDFDLMDLLGIPRRIFGELALPKTVIGGLSAEIDEVVGFQTKVVLPATHDTGSAVLALPTNATVSVRVCVSRSRSMRSLRRSSTSHIWRMRSRARCSGSA